MEKGERVKSFISGKVRELARTATLEIEGEHNKLIKLEVGFGEENPMYVSDNEELLKVVLGQITDEEGRTFFIGYTEE